MVIFIDEKNVPTLKISLDKNRFETSLFEN
jgi:hypothetical protein